MKIIAFMGMLDQFGNIGLVFSASKKRAAAAAGVDYQEFVETWGMDKDFKFDKERFMLEKLYTKKMFSEMPWSVYLKRAPDPDE